MDYVEMVEKKEHEVWFKWNECGQTNRKTFVGDEELFNFAKNLGLIVVLPTEEWVEEKIKEFRAKIKEQQKKK